MARRKILNEQEILEAHRLRNEERLSNRKIAEFFEVGKTTIWDNVYSTKPRLRKKVKYHKYTRCEHCGILNNPTVIISNDKIGGLCLGCAINILKLYPNITSGQIADFIVIELALVNKYWFIVKKDNTLNLDD